jgi:chromosome segregation ATPase
MASTQGEVSVSQANQLKMTSKWLQLMRGLKIDQLRREAELLAQSHEREVDRKDALIQLIDRDLDEAEEQHRQFSRFAFHALDELLAEYTTAVEHLVKEFETETSAMSAEFVAELAELRSVFAREEAEMESLIETVTTVEAIKAQSDLGDHQSLFEMIRNRDIEEDHQMRSNLEERIEQLKEKCNAQLTSYKQATEQSSLDYKAFLQKDAELTDHVEKRLKEVERINGEIGAWRVKLSTSRRDWQERNSQLKQEKDVVQKHLSDLKIKMQKVHGDERRRLFDLTNNAGKCRSKLTNALQMTDKIIRLHDLSRKLESQQETLRPFGARISDHIPQEEDEETRQRRLTAIEELNREIVPDEYGYLDGFMRRSNKVGLDLLALD